MQDLLNCLTVLHTHSVTIFISLWRMATAFHVDNESRNTPQSLKKLLDNTEDGNRSDEGTSVEECYILLLLLVQCYIFAPQLDFSTEPQALQSSDCSLCLQRTQDTAGQSCTGGHLRGCSLNMLKTRANLSPEDSDEMRRFRKRMDDMWNSSKRKVAQEFGFSEDEIAFAFAYHAAQNKALHDASELIAWLEDESFQLGKKFVLEEFANNVFGPAREQWTKKSAPELRTDTRERRKEEEAIKQSDNRQKLVAEAKQLLRQKLCWGCQANEADVLVVDCGHVSLCSTCSRSWSKCPRCKGASTFTVKVYLA